MIVYSENVLGYIKELTAKLDVNVVEIDKESLADTYFTLFGYVSGYKAFFEQNKALIDTTTTTDVAFIGLLDDLIAFLSRGGFDFDQWQECLEYIFYDVRDSTCNFERDILKL